MNEKECGKFILNRWFPKKTRHIERDAKYYRVIKVFKLWNFDSSNKIAPLFDNGAIADHLDYQKFDWIILNSISSTFIQQHLVYVVCI